MWAGVRYRLILPSKLTPFRLIVYQPGVTAKTMLIGADVGHPPQGNGAIRPSIAATVASTNGENNNFKPCVR